MKHPVIFSLLLFTGSAVYPQQPDRLLNNVIQITTTFSNEEKNYGFGFAVAEREGVVYFVTAKHVVQNDEPDSMKPKIEARFYSDKGTSVEATKLDVAYNDMDLALLSIPKPQNYKFAKECLADFADNDNAWFIGRKKDWYTPAESSAGSISSGTLSIEGTITAELKSIKPGTSGAPLLNSSGIVGMIIEDSDEYDVKAIEINIIKKIIKETWNYPFQLTQVKKGYFTDQRGIRGTTYKWIRIGDDTWMAENMNFESPNSYCYKDENHNCEVLGRLYPWNVIDSICPAGWRVASKSDFERLLEICEGSNRSAYDPLIDGGSSGFIALFAGWRSLSANFNNYGDATYFWSSDKNESNSAWALSIDGNSASAKMVSLNRSCALSVRCIKKEEH